MPQRAPGEMDLDENAKRRRKQCDFAYACFFAVGVFSLVGGFADTFSNTNAGLVALLIGLWLAVPACIAALIGILLSVVLWRHWPLPFLSLLALVVLVVVATEFGPISLYKGAPIAYGITCVAFTLVWLFRVRRLFQ